MTEIRCRKEAESDLREIIAYYEDVAPEALPAILADIRRAIERLAAFPHSGMRVPDRDFRRTVSLK